MTELPRRAPLLSLALVSGAALATEILLIRAFAVVHWHHFAYMIISLALLGFGAAGTFLALAHRRLLRHFAVSYLANLMAFGVLVVASPALALALPFAAEALLWDPRQLLWLVAMYVVLAAPFFCAANAIGLALIAHRKRVGRVYAADLIGAGLGAALVLGLLYWLWPGQVLKVVAATGFVAVMAGAVELGAPRKLWSGVAAAGVIAVLALPPSLLRFEPGDYKGLSQALRVHGTTVVLERSSPLGRVTVVDSPAVPLRFAPGLSLNWTTEPPPQLGLFTDGDGLQAITAAASPARLGFLANTTSALAWRVAEPRKVLVPAAGGGMEILRAVALGSARIDALELDPEVADLLERELLDFTGGLTARAGVHLQRGEARGFLAAAAERYDLIQLSLAGAAGGGGLSGLNEDYLHTLEAFRLYLAHLEPGGFLSVTRWVDVPPRDSLKLVATVVAALESLGVADPGARLMMIRGLQTVTLLVKNGAVTAAEVAKLRVFCDESSFDPVWFPGIRAENTNNYAQLPGPWFHDGVRALIGEDRAAFTAGYAYDVRPATDDRPHFGNFFRFGSFAEAWQARARGGLALAEAGYLLLVATLAQAVVAGIVLIVLPLAVFAPLRRTPRPLRWRTFAYFAGIGLGFLFIEIAFLQKLILLVHHPTLALALVLGTFLVAAGVGSAFAGRVPHARSRRALGIAVAVVVLLGAAYAVAFDPLVAAMASWPMAARAATAAVLLAPLAFCLGLPFPLALRELPEPLVPWAWGINGCASVVSAALATLLAVEVGFGAVLSLALVLYAGILWVFPGGRWVA